MFGDDEKAKAEHDKLLEELTKVMQSQESETAGEKFARFIAGLIAFLLSLFFSGEENSDQPAHQPA